MLTGPGDADWRAIRAIHTFRQENAKMAGTKTELTVDVNAEHIGLINASKEKYGIADEGKVVRIIMDYLIVNPGVHDTVFKDVRCLRCE